MEMVGEGQDQPRIPPKRIKLQDFMEKGEVDRLSALPDCLIIEILSRLPCTKEAITTGTLSKRWKHLWTLLPTLSFTNLEYCPSSNFVSFVDKTLTQCRQSKLKKFELYTSYCFEFESKFNNWVRYAIRCNVEELHLQIWNVFSEDEFLVDQFFFISSCFTDLRLEGCILNPDGAISWKNLRRLCISEGKLDEDLIEKIISGSPVLETLELDYCYGYRRLDITSKSVKKLVLSGYSDPEDDYDDPANIIKINAPNIISLTIKGDLSLRKILLINVSSLVEVNFDYKMIELWGRTRKEAEEEMLKGFVLNLCNFKELKVGSFCYKVDQFIYVSSCLAELRLARCILNPSGAISWKNLRFLHIEDVKLNEDMIENILSGSPVLETLELDCCYGYRQLNITSKSVKKLVFSGYMDPEDDDGDLSDIIKIKAPNLLSLTIGGELVLWKVLLLNVSSLVEAKLCYEKRGHVETTPEETEEEMLKGFIQMLSHVKELKIGDVCCEVLSRLEAKGLVFPSNVKLTRVITYD